MAKWDIAQAPFTCAGGEHVVGQGEVYRVSNLPRRIGHCEECAIRLFNEPAPAHIEARDFLQQLRDRIAQSAPRKTEEFSKFNRFQVGAELRSNITTQRQKATPASVDTSARQASCDPRGQNHRRHGVVEAIRKTTVTDWRARQTGERE